MRNCQQCGRFVSDHHDEVLCDDHDQPKGQAMRETLTLNKDKKREKRPTRREELNDFLRECIAKQVIKSPNEFAEEVKLIPELYMALQTGRPELIKVAGARALNEEECKALFHFIGVLIETNVALRTHAEQVGKLVSDWGSLFKGLGRLGIEIDNFAQFKVASEDDQISDS